MQDSAGTETTYMTVLVEEQVSVCGFREVVRAVWQVVYILARITPNGHSGGTHEDAAEGLCRPRELQEVVRV